MQVGLVLPVLATAALAFLLDRWSKGWIIQQFQLYESRPILPDIFHLTYVQNTGAAFGLLTDQTVALSVISVLVIVAILFYAPRVTALDVRLALGLVVGGAAGNLYDRILRGSVVDFLDFQVWPVFNLADVAIVVGVAWIVYRLLTHGEAVLH